MEKIENRVIRGESLRIDGKAFIGCVLENCLLEYSGAPFMLVDTELKGCRYVFFGPAKGTVHFLQSVGMLHEKQGEWGEFSERVQ